MSKLRDDITAAVEQDDPRKAGRIADNLRAHGFRYTQIFKMFNRITAIAEPEFDALMYEADTINNRS